MDYSSYLKKYNKNIYELINNVNANLIEKSVKLIQKSTRKKSKVYIVGNGGSASIASHVSVDFAKVANVSSATFNNSNLIIDNSRKEGKMFKTIKIDIIFLFIYLISTKSIEKTKTELGGIELELGGFFP